MHPLKLSHRSSLKPLIFVCSLHLQKSLRNRSEWRNWKRPSSIQHRFGKQQLPHTTLWSRHSVRQKDFHFKTKFLAIIHQISDCFPTLTPPVISLMILLKYRTRHCMIFVGRFNLIYESKIKIACRVINELFIVSKLIQKITFVWFVINLFLLFKLISHAHTTPLTI